MDEVASPRIRTKQAIDHFESKAELARHLKIKPQAITSWGEYVPKLRAFQLREMFPDVFGASGSAAADRAA